MDFESETDADILWEEVLDLLDQSDLPKATFAMLQNCEAASFEDDSVLTIAAPTKWVARKVSSISKLLSETAAEVAYTDIEVKVVLDESKQKKPDPEKRRMRMSAPAPAPQPTSTPAPVAATAPAAPAPAVPAKKNPLVEEVTSVNSLLTFERFVEGPQNKFAADAAKQVANGNHNYNPLFIYGKSGLGKTHLLRAIQNYLAVNDPECVCVYRVATDFIDDYAKAMKNARAGAAETLAENYHSIDVLIIDDIQLMANAAGTVNFFFDTFNYLTSHGKQIVLAADRTPSDLGMGKSCFDERVTSRLDSGMSVAVQVPDYEMKLQLVDAFYDRMRADAREQNIPGTDAEISENLRRLMAERSGTNIRVIEGFVQSCLMLAARKEEYGEELAEADIIHIAEQKWPTGQRRITAERIQTVIEANYDISHEDLVGNKRNKEFTEPRHIAIWLTRELTGETLAEIGRQYGGRSHATVKHSIAVIEKAVSEDRGLAERVANLREEIGEA